MYFWTLTSFLFDRQRCLYYFLHIIQHFIFRCNLNTIINIFYNSSLLQTGNRSKNSTERIDHKYCFLFVGVCICMVVENIISIIILCKCTRLLSQIKLLSLNLAISDILTRLVITLPTRILHEIFQCDVKKYPSFMFINVSLLIITMMNLDRCFAAAFATRYYSFFTKKLIIRTCVMA